MKVAQIKDYNDHLIIDENLPQPSVLPGKVLIKVHAAGVNPVDWRIRGGFLKEFFPLHFPATLGVDFSGVILAVGEGVSDFKKGDDIYGQPAIFGGELGTFSEIILISPQFIIPKSKEITHIEAASLPLVSLSAWQALVDTIGLKKGQKILIHGGTGGIGTIAIQLAKYLGAYVATTVSESGKSYVKELGADEIIDYKNQSFEDLLHDYDAVLDSVGGNTYFRSFKVLKKGGIIVSMLEAPRTDLMEKYGVKAIFQFTEIGQERLAKIAELINKGVLKVYIDKVFPLEQAEQALLYMQTGHPRGKVVLEIDKSS